MSDARDTLVNRMQALADLHRLESDHIEANLCEEAAAEITRLRAAYQYSEQHAARLLAERDEACAALSAQPAAVPGWQWVPVEPTPEMKDACLKATKGWWDSRAWPAILAAAPQAPQQDNSHDN